ncbi:MAG: stage II sporulation protein D [Bacilli bacterium]|nr:stage II sporulation protein D [Bacilli bacterium]
MKRLIQFTILLISLPIITILILKTEEITIKHQKLNIEKNTIVRVKRHAKNTIENIPLEKYLIGVLSGEMPVSYELEALKAQAVAARTYTLRKLEINKDNEYDLVDTTSDQVYLDEQYLKNLWGDKYQEYTKKIKQAINETAGIYLTYNDQIIQAFFFSTSSGNTENCKDVFGADLPYLTSVASTWDETSPSYQETKTFTKEEFYTKLSLEYNETLTIDITRNTTNSINTITINNTQIKGTDFRFKLGLRSTNFEITEQNNIITIKTKGYGHGVGMSQYGARQLAIKGYKYEDILKHYYQGIELKKI